MRSHRGGDRAPSPSSRETAPARCRSPPIHIQFLIKLRRNVVVLVLGQWILQRRWRRLRRWRRSEEHTSELQSLMRISYDVFCLKKKKNHNKVEYISVTYIYNPTYSMNKP